MQSLLRKSEPFIRLCPRAIAGSIGSAHFIIPAHINTTARTSHFQSNIRYYSSTPTTPPAPFETIIYTDKIQEIKVNTTDAIVAAAPETPPGFFDGILNTLQTGLEGLHDLLGTPWWATIAIACVTIRTCLIPLIIRNTKISATLNQHAPKIHQIKEQYPDDPMTRARLIREETGGLNSFSLLLPVLFQAPIFVAMFSTLKHMANVNEFKDGGALWFTDLTVPDPYYIIPVLSTTATVAAVEISMRRNFIGGTFQHKAIRIVSLFSFFVVAFQPACIGVYWACSNLFTIFQTVLVTTPSVRQLLGIGPLAPPFKPSNAPNFNFTDIKQMYAKIREDQQKVLQQQRANIPSNMNLPKSVTHNTPAAAPSATVPPTTKTTVLPTITSPIVDAAAQNTPTVNPNVQPVIAPTPQSKPKEYKYTIDTTIETPHDKPAPAAAKPTKSTNSADNVLLQRPQMTKKESFLKKPAEQPKPVLQGSKKKNKK